jgi:hypothetical protein
MQDRQDYDSRDPVAKKARKSVEQKHKSRRRHDEKDHLKRYVEDYNAGKRDIDYDNEDED